MFKRFTGGVNKCRFFPVLLICALVFQVAEAGVFPEQASNIRDPHFGMALFEAYQQNNYSAIVTLIAAQKQGQLKRQQVDSQLLLGDLYLSYGLHAEAEKIFQELSESEIPPAAHNRAWFYLGKLYYQKQLFQAAENAFEKVGEELDPGLREEFYTLQANLLMRKGKYAEAADSLAEVIGDPLSSTLYFARYNLGVALVKADRHREGVDVLRELGRVQTRDPEIKLLRDKANLTLGFLILKRAPVIARDFLRRISLDGPYANRALLGLGWAEVERQNDEVALVPLKQLAQRGGVDIAVFDSMLLIGNVLERMRAYPQAIQAYQEAIAIYERELTALDTALDVTKVGRNLDDLLAQMASLGGYDEQGWFWEAQTLPASSESRYLFTLMAGDEYHEGIKNLRDLAYLSQKLESDLKQLPVNQYLVTQRQATFDSQLKQLKPEATLARVTQMRARRDSFAAELTRITTEKDAFSLANKKERALLVHLASVEQGIRDMSNDEATEGLLERVELLKGLLNYKIETNYASRYQAIEQQLVAIDKLLEQTLTYKHSLELVRDQAPQQFAGLRERLDQQAGRIVALQAETKEVFNIQKQQLQSLAESDLLGLRNKLREYLDRARLSLALAQDQVLSQQGPEQEINEVVR